MNGNNPYYNLGNIGSGGLLGYVTNLPQTLSTSATYTDVVLSAPLGSKLLLQSGNGGAGIMLNESNFVVFNNRTTCNNTFYVSGASTLNNLTTCTSSLNVSGNSTLANITTCLSSLNVSGNTILANITTCLSSLNVSGLTTFENTGYFKSNISLSENSAFFAPAGFLKYVYMGDNCTVASNLYVTGNTTLNNITTCISSLNVSGVSIFQNATTYLSTLFVSGTSYLQGFVGIGTTPLAPLTITNLISNKIICMYDIANNSYQFTGFGTNGGLTLVTGRGSGRSCRHAGRVASIY